MLEMFNVAVPKLRNSATAPLVEPTGCALKFTCWGSNPKPGAFTGLIFAANPETIPAELGGGPNLVRDRRSVKLEISLAPAT